MHQEPARLIKMPAVETMALWVAVVALGAQIKGMAGTGKREREKVRLLREQAENTKKILKLLEDKKTPSTPPDPAMAGVLSGLRGALDDISRSPDKKPGELHALDHRISSILQQYHHYNHVASNNIHRDYRDAHAPPPTMVAPWQQGASTDSGGDWGHVVRGIVEDARVTVQGAWHATHNVEEVLRVAQLAQQVADLMERPHAASRLMRDAETSWPLLRDDLRDALRDARWVVWYSQWYHLSRMPSPSSPQASSTSSGAGGCRPPLQPAAQILDAAVKKIEFCLQVLPAIGYS